MTATAGAADSDEVLWDVVEEHFSEAEFALEQGDTAAESPVLTLQKLAAGTEARLLAHVDALVIGGKAVRDRLLEPALKEPDLVHTRLAVVAALAILASTGLDALLPFLASENAETRRAAARACALAPAEHLTAWLPRRFESATSVVARTSLLEIGARAGARLPPLIEWLQHGDPAVARAAAGAARFGDPAMHLPVLEYLLDHADEGVRDAALVAALAWDSRKAWSACAREALDEKTPHALPMALYAALGGPAEHDRLAALSTRPGHTRDVLFALGFSGDVRLLPLLVKHAESPVETERKLAAQAVAMITGVDLTTVARAADAPAPPAAKSPAAPAAASPAAAGQVPAPTTVAAPDLEAATTLPPLEEDDLSADLVPGAESALPDPDAAALRRHCQDVAQRASPDRRLIAGAPCDPAALLRELERAPLGQRHTLALALFVRAGGASAAWVDTRAFAKEQRARLSRAQAAAWVRRFGGW
jgi:uncharacterized protein (TIGR02270 family)